MATALIITEQNGEKLEVHPTLEDRLAFETALRKNKSWGKLEDNALKLTPFLAYNAARRAGDPRTWEEFTTGDTAAASVDEKPEETDPEDKELEVSGVGKDTPTARSTSSRSRSRVSTAAPRGNGAEKPDPS